MSIEYLAEIL